MHYVCKRGLREGVAPQLLKDYAAVAAKLLKTGAPLGPNSRGETPLHVAVVVCSLAAVKVRQAASFVVFIRFIVTFTTFYLPILILTL